MKKIIIIILTLFVVWIIVVLRQLYNSESYHPYFFKEWNESISFTYDYKEQKPVGVVYNDDVNYIYFLKDRYSQDHHNQYIKKVKEYQWDYQGYQCIVELNKNTVLIRYGQKSAFLFMKVDDFWIRQFIDFTELSGNLDFENFHDIQTIMTPYMERMLDIYKNHHQQIQNGCEELLKSDDKVKGAVTK